MINVSLYGALKHKYPNRNQISVKIDGGVETITAWDVPDVPEPPPESEWSSIKEEYALHLEATKYQRDRFLEYPSLQELVVALYDEEDKQALIERRNAVKAKYPKPE